MKGWAPAGLAVCLALGWAGDGQAAERKAFVTSVTGTGDLGSWVDAGASEGLEAADAICQQRATQAGLTNGGASTFVAWLSDSQDDAYCRLHGLSGKRSANCGQASLPAAAGPWFRVDGTGFAGSVAELTGASGGVVLNPLYLDENGAERLEESVFTSTEATGALVAGATPCANWISAESAFVARGATEHTTTNWTKFGSVNCNAAYHLYCMETGPGGDELALPQPGRIVFLTSKGFGGNLGAAPEAGDAVGVAAGDAICRSLATTAGLPQSSSYVAWLSDGTNAIDRLSAANDGPWYRPDGVLVAETKADLVDGRLASTLQQTELGAYVGNAGAWTGTLATGLFAPQRCGNWTSGSGPATGRSGRPDSVIGEWTDDSSTATCGSTFRLYCFEDSNRIFADDFEDARARWIGAGP